MSQEIRPQRPEIFALEIWRAVAALGVVMYHFQVDWQRHIGPIHGLPNLLWGSAGVDLFFVISGYIMVYASARLFGTRDGPRTFGTRRLIRIVPLYWLVTSAYLVGAVIAPEMPHKG